MLQKVFTIFLTLSVGLSAQGQFRDAPKLEGNALAVVVKEQAIPPGPLFYQRQDTRVGYFARHALSIALLLIPGLVVNISFSQQNTSKSSKNKKTTKKAPPIPNADALALTAKKELDNLKTLNLAALELQGRFEDRMAQAMRSYKRTGAYDILFTDIYPTEPLPDQVSQVRDTITKQLLYNWAANAKPDFPNPQVKALQEIGPQLSPMQGRLQEALDRAKAALNAVPSNTPGKKAAAGREEVPSRSSLSGEAEELFPVAKDLIKWYDLWPTPPQFDNPGTEAPVVNSRYFFIVWKYLGNGQYLVAQYELVVAKDQKSVRVTVTEKLLDPEGAFKDPLRAPNKSGIPLPPGIPPFFPVWEEGKSPQSITDFLNNLKNVAGLLPITPYGNGVFPRDRATEQQTSVSPPSNGIRNGIAEFLQAPDLGRFTTSLQSWFPSFVTPDQFLKFLTGLYDGDSKTPRTSDHAKITAVVFETMARLLPLSKTDTTLDVRRDVLRAAKDTATSLLSLSFLPTDIIYELSQMQPANASGLRSRNIPATPRDPNVLGQKIIEDIKQTLKPVAPPAAAPKARPQAYLRRSV